jgi:hypothetical protein
VTIDAQPWPDCDRVDGSYWIASTVSTDPWAAGAGTSGRSGRGPGQAGGAVTRRVLVTGSRTWVDAETIRGALRQVWGNGSGVLVSGACLRGADRIAEQLWQMVAARADVCLVSSVTARPGQPIPPDWPRPPASPTTTTRTNTNRANRE